MPWPSEWDETAEQLPASYFEGPVPIAASLVVVLDELADTDDEEGDP
jgi:hypothetical protein